MLPGIKFVSKAFTLGLQGMSVAPGTVITTMVLGCAAATASISASWSLIEPIGGDDESTGESVVPDMDVSDSDDGESTGESVVPDLDVSDSDDDEATDESMASGCSSSDDDDGVGAQSTRRRPLWRTRWSAGILQSIDEIAASARCLFHTGL